MRTTSRQSIEYEASTDRARMQRRLARIEIGACTLAFASLLAPGGSLAFAQSAAAFDKGLLWRIEKEDMRPSHLFGTVHLADKRVTALPEVVRYEFGAAQSFTLEVSLDQSNVTALAARMLYMDGRNLEAVAGETLYQKFVRHTAELGLPVERTRHCKP